MKIRADGVEHEAVIHKSDDGGLSVRIPEFGTSKTYHGIDEIYAVAELLQEHGAQLEIPCRFCGKWTPMLGTRSCNHCWEVASRIVNMPPDVLKNILRDNDRS